MVFVLDEHWQSAPDPTLIRRQGRRPNAAPSTRCPERRVNRDDAANGLQLVGPGDGIIGEGKPPALLLPRQHDTAVDLAAREGLLMAARQLDRQEDGATFFQRTHLQPEIKRAPFIAPLDTRAFSGYD